MFQGSRSRGVGYSLLLVASTASCGYTPLSTMNALDDINPLTTPAESLRVMVAVPPVIRPQKDAIHLMMKFAKTETLPEKRYDFVLQRTPRTPVEMRVGEKRPIYVFRINPKDVSRFNAMRKAAEKYDDGKDDDDNDLSIDANACRMTQTMPAKVPMSVYLKTAELDDYVVVVKNINAMEDTAPDEIDEDFPLCTSENSETPAK